MNREQWNFKRIQAEQRSQESCAIQRIPETPKEEITQTLVNVTEQGSSDLAHHDENTCCDWAMLA